ncbi:MAG TPA: porin [Fibrobacteria bacterium]|jgi:hypothetical protein|nr:porin [Fibrobacteria bacterium]
MRKALQTGLMAGTLAMGLIAAPSFADIKVNDQLTLSGFLDMSAYETGDAAATATFDQFEVDFMYKFSDKLSARADISQGGVGGGLNNVRLVTPSDTITGSSIHLEQAFVTYTEGPLSLMVGKFLSATGYECAEPTCLYQYSASATVSAYGGYNTGVGASYTVSPMASLYGAVFSSEWSGDATIATPGGEAGLTLTPMEGVTVKGFYLFENIEQPGPDYLKNGVNVWASYAKGPLLVAGEVNYLMNWDAEDSDGLGFLVMGNYKLTDKIAGTVRYSQLKTDAMADPSNEFTISPSYSITGNWWALAEYRRDIEAKVNSYALETTLTF